MKTRYKVISVILFIFGGMSLTSCVAMLLLPMILGTDTPLMMIGPAMIGLVYGALLIGFGVFARARGRKRAKREAEEAAKKQAEQETNGAVSEAVAASSVPVASAPAASASAERNPASDAHAPRTARRSPAERAPKTKLPNARWFAEKGMPLKEIPVEKSTLRSFSDEERTAFSLTTYAVLKKKLLFAVAVILVAVAVIVVMFVQNPLYGAITVLVVLFGGGFLLGKTGQLLEGFLLMKGAGRLGLNPFLEFLLELMRFVFMVFNIFASFIYMALDMIHKEKSASLPRVALPEGCGYEAILNYYSEYEEAVSNLDEMKMNAKQAEYRQKQQALGDMQRAVDNSDLGMQDKAQLGAAIGEVKRKNEETYHQMFGPDDH